METRSIGFFGRLALACRLLFDGLLAARAVQALETAPEAAPAPDPEPAAPEPPAEAPPTAALQLLALLQREGRFVDFIKQDVADETDADIGAGARVVHQGCRRALDQYLSIAPVRGEGEGDAITLEAGFDPGEVRLTGNVVGEPPFRGHLAHHGWKVTDISLPQLAEGHDAHIVAPAEVELS